MSYFNYRVFKEEEQVGPSKKEEVYTIRTVYYNDNNTLKAYSESAAYPVGNTIEELRENISQIVDAFRRPVLTEKDFEDGTTTSE